MLSGIINTVFLLFLYYIFYLLGVAVSRLWLFLRIPVLLFAVSMLFLYHQKVEYSATGVFTVFAPLFFLVMPSVAATARGVQLPFLPLEIISRLVESVAHKAQQYRSGMRAVKQRNEQSRSAGYASKEPAENGRHGGQAAASIAPETAYRILGVAEDVSLAEIRRAYLKLMWEHSPDRTRHLGPDAQKTAHEQCVRFNLAWETIKTKR